MSPEKIKELGLGFCGQSAVDVWDIISDEWINQNEFDRKVNEIQMTLRPVSVYHTDGYSLIPPMNGFQDHLFSLKVMYKNDLVEAKDEDDLVWYRKAEIKEKKK